MMYFDESLTEWTLHVLILFFFNKYIQSISLSFGYRKQIYKQKFLTPFVGPLKN